MQKATEYPLVSTVAFFAGLSMVVPAIHAAINEELATGRAFFYSGLLVAFFSAILGIAVSSLNPMSAPGARLLELFIVYCCLPLVLAVPLASATNGISFADLYFEMVSCLTTTGATYLSDHPELPSTIHLWRAQVGWMGGFLVWVTIAAFMEPLRISGFELISKDSGDAGFSREGAGSHEFGRLRRNVRFLLPWYLGLSMTVWLWLLLAGESPMSALLAAMGTISTSGIHLEGGIVQASGGFAGELILFVFLLLALSRLLKPAAGWTTRVRLIPDDLELRIAAILVVGTIIVVLVLEWPEIVSARTRHDLVNAVNSIWAATFTTVSFLTTTGYASVAWSGSEGWQGSSLVSLLLLGAAFVGGGATTTAGGLKLLRVAVLLKLASTEVAKLSQPSAVKPLLGIEVFRADASVAAGQFLMLLLFSMAIGVTVLAAFGNEFRTSLALSIAALSTTGPLPHSVLGPHFCYGELGALTKLVLSFLMILGRLELLALIALLNPIAWRR